MPTPALLDSPEIDVNPLEDFDFDVPAAERMSDPPPALKPDHDDSCRAGDVLYFDLETVPDYDRLELFDLEPVREPQPDTAQEFLISPEQFIETDLKGAAKFLELKFPPAEWLARCEELEKAKEKPRAGFFPLIDAKRADNAARVNAVAERNKLLSVTPLYCRIVALGYAVGSNPPRSIIAQDRAGEMILLERFWALFEQFSPLVGFNCLHFDVPAVLARSILLDVKPPRIIDRRKYGSRDVVDLQRELYGDVPVKGFGLKRTAKLLGIDVPEDHGDGGQVLQLFEARDWAALSRYVEGDIRLTQELHRKKLSGRFCA